MSTKISNKRNGNMNHELYVVTGRMSSPGRSKHRDKLNKATFKRIYSYNTLGRYRREGRYFIDYIQGNHPECKTLKDCRQYIREWIEYESTRVLDNGRTQSAWTMCLKICAIHKIFQIKPGDPDYMPMPKRFRGDILRSRCLTPMDLSFMNENHLDIITFAQSTGCRRDILKRVKGSDYMTIDELKNEMDKYDSKEELSPEERSRYILIREAITYFSDCEHFLFHSRDKGGRSRIAPILGPFEDRAVELIMNTPKDEKVFKSIPNEADVHSFRNDYSCSVYRRYARRIKDIPYDRVNKGSGVPYQSDVYILRKDQYGRKLDRAAMAKVSKALGHNRIRIAADNYLYGMEDEDHEDD